MRKLAVKRNSAKDRMNPTRNQFEITLKSSASVRLQPLILVAACLCCLLVFSGCAKVPYRSDPQLEGYTEYGIASFYSMKYQFRKTASGERFNQMALTAAHRKLPFGTKVRVTNLKNNRSVTVKINDRGPFIKGRIIDLTRYAFSKIGDTEVGLLQVKIEVVN